MLRAFFSFRCPLAALLTPSLSPTSLGTPLGSFAPRSAKLRSFADLSRNPPLTLSLSFLTTRSSPFSHHQLFSHTNLSQNCGRTETPPQFSTQVTRHTYLPSSLLSTLHILGLSVTPHLSFSLAPTTFLPSSIPFFFSLSFLFTFTPRYVSALLLYFTAIAVVCLSLPTS